MNINNNPGKLIYTMDYTLNRTVPVSDLSTNEYHLTVSEREIDYKDANEINFKESFSNGEYLDKYEARTSNMKIGRTLILNEKVGHKKPHCFFPLILGQTRNAEKTTGDILAKDLFLKATRFQNLLHHDDILQIAHTIKQLKNSLFVHSFELTIYKTPNTDKSHDKKQILDEIESEYFSK